jgi:SAM-dependent methyltransferase
MSDSDRAVIFGRDAARYDAARPGYPDAVVAHVIDKVDPGYAVEIGAGTGKATAAFAAERRRITCLEPDPDMAAVLAGKMLPGVTVEVARFEDWKGEPGSVDLLYAAQSWHWVDPSVGFGKATEKLRTGGVLALLWNVPLDRYGRFVDVYREFGPEVLAEQDGRIYERDQKGWLPDLVANGFGECELFVHPWSSRLSAVEFRDLCSTYSDHMMIPEPRRARLLDALEEEVEAGGGWFEIEYEARVFTGRK